MVGFGTAFMAAVCYMVENLISKCVLVKLYIRNPFAWLPTYAYC